MYSVFIMIIIITHFAWFCGYLIVGSRAPAARTYVLVDEVYRDAHLGAPLPCAAVLSASAVSTFSLTKVFGLSGVRMGIIFSRCPDAIRAILSYHTIAECGNPGLLEDLWIQV
jgi:aspartate/methionine/tyrosine aminotransferase